MYCIRIEHPKSKHGMFRHIIDGVCVFDIRNDMDSIRSKHHKMPTPWSDKFIKDYFNESMVCAYHNISALRKYVPIKPLKILIKEYSFKVYKIKLLKTKNGKQVAFKGEYQIVFKPNKAIIKKENITSLFLI